MNPRIADRRVLALIRPVPRVRRRAARRPGPGGTAAWPGYGPAAWTCSSRRGPDAGEATLPITGCHGPDCCSPPQPGGTGSTGGTAMLYAACHRVLALGGILAVITSSRSHDGH